MEIPPVKGTDGKAYMFSKSRLIIAEIEDSCNLKRLIQPAFQAE